MERLDTHPLRWYLATLANASCWISGIVACAGEPWLDDVGLLFAGASPGQREKPFYKNAEKLYCP
jgi:hypothetical protein